MSVAVRLMSVTVRVMVRVINPNPFFDEATAHLHIMTD